MRTLLLALWLSCASVMSAPPSDASSALRGSKAVPLDVVGDTVQVVKSFPIKMTAGSGAGYYAWTVPSSVTYTKSHNVLTITAAPKGLHKITVAAISGKVGPDKVTVEFSVDEGETVIVVGDVPIPVPPGPVPPEPIPPTPTPVGDLRVLIVHEEAELAKIPIEQLRILRGPKFRDTLNAKVSPDKTTPNGKGYWILDKDADVSKLSKFWQDGMKRNHPSLPYIHIFRGDAPVHEGPLPAKEDEAIALISKYSTKEGK